MVYDRPVEWKRDQLLIFLVGSLFQLILLLSYFDGLDWKIQYHSALDILSDIPFYLQKNRVINGENIWNANHPPVFFYALALMMKFFGSSQIVGRIMLWLYAAFVFVLLVEITDPQDSKEYYLVAFFYYLNPITCIVLVLGIFDLFLFTYILGGMYLLDQEYYVGSSILLGFGIMTKTIPVLILGIFVAYFLIKMRPLPAVKLFLPAALMVLVVYTSLYEQYGEVFLSKLYGFQLDRNTPNISIWYAWFGYELDQDIFLYFQLGVLIISSLIAVSMINQHPISKYNATAFIFAVFSLVLRTYYTHYGIWYMIPMIPVLLYLYRKQQIGAIVYVLTNFIIFGMILMVCIFSCFDDPNPVLWLVRLHSLGHFLPTLAIACFNVYLAGTWKKYEPEE